MLEVAGKLVYFAGDTGYGTGNIFRNRARFGAIDLAILPIGAYDPRWFMAAQHCEPEDAIRIMLDARQRPRSACIGGRSNRPTSHVSSPRNASSRASPNAGSSPNRPTALHPADVADFN